MTEKHNWVTDDLCLIEETTGVKLYGTVCTDISFIAKQLNMANKTIRKLEEENTRLKKENEELLYQIGEVGKNNKTCRECECFIPKIKYCYMWDMEVEADDVVVACDQRKVKNTNEMMSDD